MSPPTSSITSTVLSELIALMQGDDKDTVGKTRKEIQAVIELVRSHALVPVFS